jgi:hypothetical protein
MAVPKTAALPLGYAPSPGQAMSLPERRLYIHFTTMPQAVLMTITVFSQEGQHMILTVGKPLAAKRA